MNQFQIDKLEELRALISRADRSAIAAFIEDFQPIDFAELVSELEDDEIAALTPLLDDDTLASLMEESEDKDRIRIARTLDNTRLLTAFEYMQKDDIVDILGDF
ncbi:MAG: magnesium transporter, partial [Lachnospiraceae bacterium]|nr:magnesium transporter [Lachnospiraceae bacterium]